MQTQIEIRLNRAGVGELLKCDGMQSLLKSRAEAIAGDGSVEVYVAGTRAVAEAKGDNHDNAMLKRLK